MQVLTPALVIHARCVIAAALGLLALAGCGGGSATSSSASEPVLDGSWSLTIDCNDGTRVCSQAGTLTLRQGRVVEPGGSGFTRLEFTGSIAVPSSTCADLRVPNWPVRVSGFFFSAGGFVGKYGSFDEFDCGGSCIGYSTFFIDVAQPNRLSGRTDCSFLYTAPSQQRIWYGKGTWVADRQR